MAPLPNNNTAVFYLDYTSAGEEHTHMCRFDAPNSPADAMASVIELLEAVDDIMFPMTVLGARVRVKGGSVSNPVIWTGDTTYGLGTPVPGDTANMLNFIGRSSGGRRVRAGFLGCTFSRSGGDFRAYVDENVSVDAGWDVLVAAEGTYLSIDGLPAVWNSYANIGPNAYWRNKVR